MSEVQVAVAQQLPDFVDLEFARRLEMAETILPDCVEALRRFNPATPCEAETVAGGVAFFGGMDYPSNQIVGMGLYGEVRSADMDRVEDFFGSRGVSSTIVLSPLADMSLPALLGERGYRIVEFNSVLIRRINAEEPFTAPAGIVIERASRQNVSSWAHTLAKGFSQDSYGWGRCFWRLRHPAGRAGVSDANRRRGGGWVRWPHHSRSADRRSVRRLDAAGVSRPRSAERADCPAAARSL